MIIIINFQFDIIKIEEKMLYTPKKNIQAFIETKNEQIRSLKQKILGSRVTYEDMDNAKSRLTSIKSAQLQLQRQDHLELKEVLKTSQQAVNDLMKRKNRLLEELQHYQKQSQEMGGLECQLVTKKQKADQILREVLEIKDKLLDRKDKKNTQIAQLEEQITIRRKQLTMQREIGDELEVARSQLKTKVVRVNKDLTEITDENKRLRESIRKQLEDISKLEHQQENDQLRIQNMQLKIEKEEKHAQNLQQKIDSAQTFMQRFSQDKLIYLKESQTASNIDSLLKLCTESNQKKHREQKQCQEEINQIQKKIEIALMKRQSLMNDVAIKQQNLKQLKSKGAELKSILNSIFHQDSSVLKLIADKKVYESEQTVKKTPQVQLKQDMQDLIDTSENFFMTSH